MERKPAVSAASSFSANTALKGNKTLNLRLGRHWGRKGQRERDAIITTKDLLRSRHIMPLDSKSCRWAETGIKAYQDRQTGEQSSWDRVIT